MIHKFLSKLNFAPFIQYEPITDDNHKISGITIKKVDLIGITELIFEHLDPKNNLKKPMIKQQFDFLTDPQKRLLVQEMIITRYCIHRVLTHHKLFHPLHTITPAPTKNSKNSKIEPSNTPEKNMPYFIWNYHLDQDYYGEEVSQITLKSPLAEELSRALSGLQHKSSTERIEYVLKMEYGYLIPSVKGRKWYVVQIAKGDLYFSNQEHYEKCVAELQQEESKEYTQSLLELKYPRAITARVEPHKYKVIDGYHRLAGSGTEKPPIVICNDRGEN